MVVYDLQCAAGHGFEGWFRSLDDFDAQRDGGLLSCPVCQSADVRRRPSATRLKRHGGDAAGPVVAEGATDVRQAGMAMAGALRQFVDRHFEDVGDRFASEARRMHYGEAEERNIRGQATRDEVRDLHDEGIKARPLPLPDPDKLN